MRRGQHAAEVRRPTSEVRFTNVRRFPRTSRWQAVRLRPRAGDRAGARGWGRRTMVAIGNGDGPPDLRRGQCGWPTNIPSCMRRSAFIRTKRLASDDAYAEMERLARHPKVIAWGEIGLDYFYDHSPRDVQKDSFPPADGIGGSGEACRSSFTAAHPTAARTPGTTACRLIEEQWAPKGIGGILHCFTGTWAHAKRALDMGFMISFAGNVTFPKAQQIRDAALDGSARPHADRDGLALSGAGPAPGQAQRTGVRERNCAQSWANCAACRWKRSGEQTSRNFYKFFKISETAETKVPTP